MSEQNQIACVHWLCFPLGKNLKAVRLQSPPFFPLATRAWQSQAASRRLGTVLPGRTSKAFPFILPLWCWGCCRRTWSGWDWAVCKGAAALRPDCLGSSCPEAWLTREPFDCWGLEAALIWSEVPSPQEKGEEEGGCSTSLASSLSVGHTWKGRRAEGTSHLRSCAQGDHKVYYTHWCACSTVMGLPNSCGKRDTHVCL